MKLKPEKKQSLITVIGTNYVSEIVPDLLQRCFDSYIKRDTLKKNFQVSVLENSYSTSAIVLTVLGFEAYRNRFYYLERKKVSKKVFEDIGKLFQSKESTFKRTEFEQLLKEIFIIRDVIIHNHIYEVDVFSDDEYEMIGHRQKLLEGYGDGKRQDKTLVNEITRKTRLLKLNVQPAKIGFEDLFIILVIFDTYIGITNKYFPNNYAPFRFSYKMNGKWVMSLSIFLATLYNKLPLTHQFIAKPTSPFKFIYSNFNEYLGSDKDYFFTNRCPKCGSFGYKDVMKEYSCKQCGHKLNFKIITGLS